MCGIAGIVGSDTKDIESMVRSLKHRGPDSEGIFKSDIYALGHRRLSIIDTREEAGQPMFSKDGKVSVAFNGEIYNFKALRKRLEHEHKVAFRTSSDTEVILELYLQKGEACFRELQGMFAIAIFDLRDNKVILARDRFGEKPLYYGVLGDTLLFSSELKSLLSHPKVRRDIDPFSLQAYLQYEYIPTPYTIIKGISKLEPATYLVFRNGKIKIETFWEFPEQEMSISFEEAKETVEKLLERSVEGTLMSDRPIGVFLSGGLDSSTIAYFASERATQRLKTFSIGFDESSFDESEYAKRVSEHLGTEHHSRMVTSKDAQELIPNIHTIMDEPLSDASILPTYLLSKFASEHIVVALGGDGGDELFSGYPTFAVHDIGLLFGRVPANLRGAMRSALLPLIPVSGANFNMRFKLQNFFSGFEDFDKNYMHQKWLGSFGRDERISLLKEEYAQESKDVFSHIDSVMQDIRGSVKNKVLAEYMRTYMMDDVLVKVDRASMAVSLEVRAPFLDHRVVDYVYSLPYEYKRKGSDGKHILKEVMRGKIPDEIIGRKKKGFGIPVSSWLRGDLAPFLKDVLSKKNIENGGIFKWKKIESLIKDHMEQKEDNGKQLWTLLIFQLWCDSVKAG